MILRSIPAANRPATLSACMRRSSVTAAALSTVLAAAELQALPAAWPMVGGGPQHTNRAGYVVPLERQGEDFFDLVRWQTPTPGSPSQGGISSTTLVFKYRNGPRGADLLVGGYHWPKGVMGLDRHSGARFWSGLPRGGESIGALAPAFSIDGSVVYVVNDATASAEYPNGPIH